MPLPKNSFRFILLAFIIIVLIFLAELGYLLIRYPSTILDFLANSEIETVSDIPGFEIEESDKPLLVGYLDKLGFFEKELSARGGIPPQKISKLVVHLTDKEQLYNRVFDSKGMMTSAGERFDGNTLNVFIYVRQNILETPEERRSSFFNGTLLLVLTDLAKPPEGDERKIGSVKLSGEILARFKKAEKYLIRPYLVKK